MSLCACKAETTGTTQSPVMAREPDAGSDAGVASAGSCKTDADCATGVCGVRGLCLAAGACDDDADCRAAGTYCSASLSCIALGSCASNGDCDEGEECDPKSTLCAPGGCSEQKFEIEAVPPNLMIALDRSCSMVPGSFGNGADKWTPAVSAIKRLTTSFESKARWGLVLFPDAEGDKCGQAAPAIELAPNNEAAIQSLLTAALNKNDALYPDGPCVTNIADTLTQLDGIAALRDAERPSRILLITDGAESGCGGKKMRDAESVATLERLSSAGTKTFVVGFGTDTDAKSMNEFAQAGGVPRSDPELKYYQADDANALEAALGEIVASVVGCDFALDTVPLNLEQVFVFLNGKKIGLDPSQTAGWDYDADKNQVRLFGDACEALQSAEPDALEIVFSCDVQ